MQPFLCVPGKSEHSAMEEGQRGTHHRLQAPEEESRRNASGQGMCPPLLDSPHGTQVRGEEKKRGPKGGGRSGRELKGERTTGGREGEGKRTGEGKGGRSEKLKGWKRDSE